MVTRERMSCTLTIYAWAAESKKKKNATVLHCGQKLYRAWGRILGRTFSHLFQPFIFSLSHEGENSSPRNPLYRNTIHSTLNHFSQITFKSRLTLEMLIENYHRAWTKVKNHRCSASIWGMWGVLYEELHYTGVPQTGRATEAATPALERGWHLATLPGRVGSRPSWQGFRSQLAHQSCHLLIQYRGHCQSQFSDYHLSISSSLAFSHPRAVYSSSSRLQYCGQDNTGILTLHKFLLYFHFW